MKPLSHYLSLAPSQVDMDDPETPESIKIAARIALEREAMAKEQKDRQGTN